MRLQTMDASDFFHCCKPSVICDSKASTSPSGIGRESVGLVEILWSVGRIASSNHVAQRRSALALSTHQELRAVQPVTRPHETRTYRRSLESGRSPHLCFFRGYFHEQLRA